MKMGRNSLLTYTVVAFVIVILSNDCDSVAPDTLSLGASLRGNQTIISPNGKYEMGFFSSNGTNNWYIGIWSVQKNTIVWVANRDNPVRNMEGVLKLSKDGYLGLFAESAASVWTANATKAASRGVILNSGIFSLFAADNKSETVWQSFDHPGNTWLAGMKFGRGRNSVSSNNSLDPDPGIFSFQRKLPNFPFQMKLLAGVGALVNVLLFIILVAWQIRGFRSTQRSADSSDELLRAFNYKELKIATRNFRYKLGSGGFGSVFKGTLTDGTLVAVKKLHSSKQGEKQFRAEINSVGIIHHVNLVRLRGFCAQGSRRLLVYDYMPNGSLNSFLFTTNSKTQPKILDWTTRFGIALGTAKGLLYLHEECRDRIIHSDIKPENILLDEDFSPKLGDFGLAEFVGRDFSHVLTTTRGTRGYLAPEWVSGLPITSKVDVYSFGMMLLELISGRRNLDLNVQESSRYYFPAWAGEQICQGNIINIVDKRIANDADVEEVRRAALVSLLCIQKDENARPNMAQVLLMLQGHTAQIPTVMMNQRVDEGNTDSDSYSDSIV